MEQQVCAKCFCTMCRQLNIDNMKCLNKKIDMTGHIKSFDW